jgi:cytochrome c biogenesis protein CcmG/thiol:disulfide interchange protein DsbE
LVRKRRAPIIAGIVGAAVLGLVVLFLTSPKVGESEETSPLLGKLAPPITGSALDGTQFNVDDARGKWVLVNFFATWCPPCIVEHPQLVQLARDNPDTLQLVSVAFSDTAPNVEAFFAEKGGAWPVLTADTGAISIDYGVKGLPESFLIDPSGVVVAKFIGGITAEGVQPYLVPP